jgi:hypothetical protein
MGARQQRLPVGYITQIETVSASEDPDKNREAQNRRILC